MNSPFDGLKDGPLRGLKAELVATINRVLTERDLKTSEAATLLGLNSSTAHALRRGSASQISFPRLFGMLTKLGLKYTVTTYKGEGEVRFIPIEKEWYDAQRPVGEFTNYVSMEKAQELFPIKEEVLHPEETPLPILSWRKAFKNAADSQSPINQANATLYDSLRN